MKAITMACLFDFFYTYMYVQLYIYIYIYTYIYIYIYTYIYVYTYIQIGGEMHDNDDEVGYSTRSGGSYNTNISLTGNYTKYENQTNISRSIDMTYCFDGGDDDKDDDGGGDGGDDDKDDFKPSSPKIEVCLYVYTYMYTYVYIHIHVYH
jgi:hypothetical protein